MANGGTGGSFLSGPALSFRTKRQIKKAIKTAGGVSAALYFGFCGTLQVPGSAILETPT